MKMPATLAAALVLALGSSAGAAELGELWNPFKPPVERWAQQIAEARARGELDLAESLLAEAERVEGDDRAVLVRERGLLARDRGRLGEAAALLARAADLRPRSEARAEQAAVLVPLGRWPEAVEVLGRAFAERGSGLPVDRIVGDARFAPLAGFGPFQDLVKRVRADQTGALGRLTAKFERIDEAVQANRSVLDVLGRWLAGFARLGEYAGTAVVVLLGLGLLVTFGVAQTGLVRAPWTLIAGMLSASALWYVGARIATASEDAGIGTILTALALVFFPWAAALAGRWAWRRWGRRRALDPFDPLHLPHTLALIEEVRRVGLQLAEAPVDKRGALVAELRGACAPLQDRLLGLPVARAVHALEDPAAANAGAEAPVAGSGATLDATVVPVRAAPAQPQATDGGADPGAKSRAGRRGTKGGPSRA